MGASARADALVFTFREQDGKLLWRGWASPGLGSRIRRLSVRGGTVAVLLALSHSLLDALNDHVHSLEAVYGSAVDSRTVVLDQDHSAFSTDEKGAPCRHDRTP